MDDHTLPFDDASFDDGAFDDGSQPPSADEDASSLVFNDHALPPANGVEDAEYVEVPIGDAASEAPAFVDGSSFIDALDGEADWDTPSASYEESPVELEAVGGTAGPSAFATPAGFAGAAGGFQSVDYSGSGGGAPGFDSAPGVAYGDADPDVTFDRPPEDPLGPTFVSGDGGDRDAQNASGAESSEEESAEASKTPSKTSRRKDSKARAKDGLMLGIHVTPKQVYGVLIRPTGEGYEPLRQFVRNRSDSGSFGDSDALSPDNVELGAATPDLSGMDDVAISFGGGAELDFSSEFAGFGDLEGVAMDAVGAEPSTVHTQPIVFELKDILDECEKSGFGRPPLALAIGAPDVDYLEMTIAPEKTGKKKPAKKGKKAPQAEEAEAASSQKASTAPVKRDRLVAQLAEMLPGVAHKDRIAFVPMTARDGHRRYLAVLPQAGEPVAPSLELLRQQGRHAKTAFRTLEGEVPLLVGLSRLVVPESEGENTAVVRVGAEDTIVLLLADGQLHHYELMQSVTAFDGPDTICSRVLLQQDVQGIGTVHNVVILADELERELVQGFSAFYPESNVETLRDGLARHGLVGPYGPLAPSLVEAAGVALAGAMKKGPFESANLLPAELRKRRRRVDFSVAWHTVAVGMLLFLSVLFFAYLYVSQSDQIADAEQRLAEFPVEAQMTVPELQARIDSLRLRQSQMQATMAALDSLIVGTDAWTQTLLKSTRAASGTGGIWIEQMEPNGASLQITGYATSRERVVGMAQRLAGTIDEMTYQDVREYPVYEYRITFPMEGGLPQITRILREQALDPAVAVDPAEAALDDALGEPSN